ncbi:MAG: hypothetical protein ACJAWP_000564 [Porticoccus sp.]
MIILQIGESDIITGSRDIPALAAIKLTVICKKYESHLKTVAVIKASSICHAPVI